MNQMKTFIIAGYAWAEHTMVLRGEEMEAMERREVKLFEKVGHGYNDKELEVTFDRGFVERIYGLV
ncbi:MAG: hypothetical protein V8S08_04785 [Lachnoclostridium sp.]